MEKKEIVVENPVAVGGLTIIPVVQVLRSFWQTEKGTSFFGIKRPVAVVVISPSARKAFRMTGEEVSVDQLVEEFPVIKGVLDKF